MDKLVFNVPYFQVPNEIFEHGLTSHQIVVYCYLCRCGNHGKQAFPSYNTIAAKTGISLRQSKYVIKQLIELGFLVKTTRPHENKDNESNIYTIVLPSAGDALPSAGNALPPSAGNAPYKELYSYKEISKKREPKNLPVYRRKLS